MISRKPRFVLLSLGALGAFATLWSLRAGAATIRCDALPSPNGGALFTFFHETYAVECQGEGMRVAGEAESSSDNRKIRVRLRFATNTTSAKATAFGYNQSMQLIPQCKAEDTSSGLGWAEDDCVTAASDDDFVKYLTMIVNGQS